MIFSLLLLGTLGSLVSGLTPAQWRNQSIYQVMTDRFARSDLSAPSCSNISYYCGGTWNGLIQKLDYIQGMGFTAVWISPVVKNLDYWTQPDGGPYHGYWAKDIYSLNEHFGTAADLKNLSTTLHKRGMYLMVDVVTNHMANQAYGGCGDCVNYSTFTPFNTKADFHPFCLIDYSNATSIVDCWEGSNTVALADLRTEDSGIASTWNSWIKALVSNYSIDGLRVDSMQQVNTGFWPDFQNAAGGIHAIGEVYQTPPDVVCPYQNYLTGVLNYPTWNYINKAFNSTAGSMSDFTNGINTMKSTCKDTTLLGSFLENQDNPRFPSYTSDLSLIKNAMGFALLADGIPILYQGQEQMFNGGIVPYNRETLWTSKYDTTSTLYAYATILNKIRSLAISKDSGYVTYKAWPIFNNTDTIAVRKGFPGQQIISVWNNRGASSASTKVTIGGNTGFTAGQKVTDVLSCTVVTVDSSGNTGITITKGLPQVLFPMSALAGSGICGN